MISGISGLFRPFATKMAEGFFISGTMLSFNLYGIVLSQTSCILS